MLRAFETPEWDARAVVNYQQWLWPRILRLARSGRDTPSFETILREFETSQRSPRFRDPWALQHLEARFRLIAYLSERLVSEFRRRARPKWPGGPFQPGFQSGPQAEWWQSVSAYFEACLKSTGFSPATIPALRDFLLRNRPFQRSRPAKQARQVVAYFWKIHVGGILRERTVRDYITAVHRLDRFAKKLEDPAVRARLVALFRRRLARNLGSKTTRQLLTLMKLHDPRPVTVTNPSDPAWLPRALFGFVPGPS